MFLKRRHSIFHVLFTLTTTIFFNNKRLHYKYLLGFHLADPLCGPLPYHSNSHVSQEAFNSSTVNIICLPGHYYPDGSSVRQLTCSNTSGWLPNEIDFEECAGKLVLFSLCTSINTIRSIDTIIIPSILFY